MDTCAKGWKTLLRTILLTNGIRPLALIFSKGMDISALLSPLSKGKNLLFRGETACCTLVLPLGLVLRTDAHT